MPKTIIYTFLLVAFLIHAAISFGLRVEPNNPNRQSLVQEAIYLIENFTVPLSNEKWPNVNPALFIKNLKENIITPERIYQGKNTYFCSYAAITYLLVTEDPITYTKCMLELYKNGFSSIRKTFFNPGKAIRESAGTFTQKKELDSAHADQIWFLCLADKFKCYLNLFNHKYDPGDEDKRWAATSYIKFDRMANSLMVKSIESTGADLSKPPIENLPDFVHQQMKKGSVVLFVNRRIKDKINKGIKLWLPRHYVVVKNINSDKSTVSLKFWDYGSIKEKKMSKKKFSKTVYGISTFSAAMDVPDLAQTPFLPFTSSGHPISNDK